MREPRRLSKVESFRERDWYPRLQIPINPATQRALAMGGKVWTPQAPHAIPPVDDEEVGPVQVAAGDTEPSAPDR